METPITRRTTNGPQPIHEAIRKVWLFSNITSILIVFIPITFLEYGIYRGLELSWRIPVLMPIVGICMLAWSIAMVKRQWHAWRYEVTDNEVIITKGVFYQVRRFVPRDRIQHVDITSGPLARKFGLRHVHLYVAGAHGSIGEIPGLTPEEAEDLRTMLVEFQAEHV